MRDYTDCDGDILYWKERCASLEDRMDDLEKEIRRLRGGRQMTDEEIKRHNQSIGNRKNPLA